MPCEIFSCPLRVIGRANMQLSNLVWGSNANNRTGGTVRTGINNSGKEKRKCN